MIHDYREMMIWWRSLSDAQKVDEIEKWKSKATDARKFWSNERIKNESLLLIELFKSK